MRRIRQDRDSDTHTGTCARVRDRVASGSLGPADPGPGTTTEAAGPPRPTGAAAARVSIPPSRPGGSPCQKLPRGKGGASGSARAVALACPAHPGARTRVGAGRTPGLEGEADQQAGGGRQCPRRRLWKSRRTQLEGTVALSAAAGVAVQPASPHALLLQRLPARPPWSDPRLWSPREDAASFSRARSRPLQLSGCVWLSPAPQSTGTGARSPSHTRRVFSNDGIDPAIRSETRRDPSQNRARCRPRPPTLSRTTRPRRAPHGRGSGRLP